MGIKFKKPKSGKKVRKLYIAACAVILLSSLLSVFSKSTSNADTEDPMSELQLASYYSALGECIGYAMHGSEGLYSKLFNTGDYKIENGDTSPSNWWDIDDGLNDYGVDSEKAQTYVNGKPTITKCTTVAEKALPLLGWEAGGGHSIYYNFLIDIGCEYDSSSVTWTCHVGDDKTRISDFRKAVKDKLGKDLGDPTKTNKYISDMAKYYWYVSDFKYGCQSDSVNSPSDSQTQYANNADSGGKDYDANGTYYININYVDPSGGGDAVAVSTIYSYIPAVYSPPSPTKGGDTGSTTTGTFSSATWLYGYIGADSTTFAKNRIYNSDDGTANAYNASACKDIAKHISSLSGVAVNYYKTHSVTDEAICAADPNAEGCQDETDSDATTFCAIEGIGWIVCPVLKFFGYISDKAYNFLSDEFLVTNPDYVQADSSNAVYNVWTVMRNIANVLFIIVFLVMVFSQLTGFGISNYGIKKLLPKLVMIAILVNVSFLLCQIAVDLSNILGYSMKQMFDGIGQYAQASGVEEESGSVLGIAGIVVDVLAGGITAALVISVPVVLSVLLALLSIILILVTRTSLIILLVIVSPLIMVSYLFPGTDNLFKKAKKLSISLLLVYPLVSLLFGAGNLAAKVINSAGQESGSLTMQLVAIGAAVLPLFALPSLLKGSMSAAGGIGAKLSGWNAAANKRIGGKVKDTSTFGAYKSAFNRNQQIKRAQILGGVYKGKNPITRGSSYLRGKVNAAWITGSVGTRTAQQAAQIANKMDIENVDAAKAQIQQANISGSDLRKIANGGVVGGINGRDVSMRAASMDTLLQRGDYKGFQDSWNSMVNTYGDKKGIFNGKSVMTSVARTMERSSNRPVFLGMSTIQAISEGKKSKTDEQGNHLYDLTLENIGLHGADKYSPLKIAQAKDNELQYVINVHEKEGKSFPKDLVDAALTALNNPEINQNIGDNREQIQKIAGAGQTSNSNNQEPGATV